MTKNSAQKGYTLFEILLVLMVISIITVSIITFVNRKTQQSSSEQLGYRLFQYGLAASEYARINPEHFEPKDDPIEFYGYEYLQITKNPENCTDPTDPDTCKPFLGKDFNLNISPLIIDDVDAGHKAKIKTVYNVQQQSFGRHALEVEIIELGSVYTSSKTVTDPDNGTSQQKTANLALARNAAHYASTYRDQAGSARIKYGTETMEADAHITGYPFNDVMSKDPWLLTTGENTMKGVIEFDNNTPAGKRQVKNVDEIQFDNGSGSTSTFRGLSVSQIYMVGNRVGGSRNVVADRAMIPVSQGVCYLVRTQFSGDKSGDVRCEISETSGNWWLRYHNAHECYAQCISWR